MLPRLINLLKKYKTLIIITIVAGVLRLYHLTDNPPSLNWDEISHGYNAYSILNSGKDEWGKFLPIIFRAYGDYKLPVYIYLTAISEFFFGLTTLTVRIPSVLAGIGTVIFTYLLVGEAASRGKLIPQKKVKLLAHTSAVLVAIEPWTLFISRAAFEANLSLFFFVAGLYFFFRSFRSKFYILYSSFLFGLTVWTYNSYRIFTPLILFTLIYLYFSDLKKIYLKTPKTILYSLFTILLFLLPMFWQLFSSQGRARYGWVSIINEGSVNEIIERRISSDYPNLITRFIHNRPVYFVEQVSKNWVKHFSYDFLYFKGGSDYQFSIPGHGLSYLINLPFFFLGLIYLIKRAYKKDKTALFLLSWLILAPLPSSTTREAPHVLRSMTMLPIMMILTANGLVGFYDWMSKHLKDRILQNVILVSYIVILLFSTVKYLNIYFGSYRRDYSWSWQYGYQDVADYIKENYSKYDKIVITKKYGEPHEFLLFYLKWDPENYQNDPNLNRFYQTNWYWVDSFDKFYFVNDWDIPESMTEEITLESGDTVDCIAPGVLERVEIDSCNKCLLISSEGNVPKTWYKIKDIKFLDGNTAFEIYEN